MTAKETQAERQKRRRRIERLKKMILGTIGALIIIPVCICLFLGICLHRANVQTMNDRQRIESLELTIKRLEEQLENAESIAIPSEPVKEQIIEDALQQEYDTALSDEVLETMKEPVGADDGIRRIYLTFDDGPSRETDVILDILKEYDVKATFFVLGKEDEKSAMAYKRIVAEGHTLGMHSYSHKYREIYASTQSFEDDIEKMQKFLYDITGVTSTIYRFPGGSSNKVSRTGIYDLIGVLEKRNIDYFDWNVSSGDAAGTALGAKQIVNNVMRGIGDKKDCIVLFHDSAAKKSTVEALPEIIERIKAMENTMLLPISQDTIQIHHVEPKDAS